ncbi:MAG: hypothetical protein DM484_16295 [Candidatus Methylumidiphilus alinenensis]|uniref:Uncharacterized protein n=1 Tax=Candidatus Methylumidiphilus alinenensis TaxID=2202197 RepID=A0A2W4QWY7_9GAMM|nr:MAG: hypothetical protein DM484_16295 [Candidatus Methylumidiphilus alinenensis]
MSDSQLEVPERSGGDVAHALAKAGLSAIPIVGGPAVELFQFVVQPPLERRREKWMAEIGEKLRKLEDQGVNLESLQSDEKFISAVMHASQIAIRTHVPAKLEALRNAVLNVATRQAPEEAVQHMFFDFIDSLSELHIRILIVFQSPNISPNINMGALSNVLESNIPELRGRRNIYDQFWRDLFSRGLVNTEGLHVMMTGQGLASKRTTSLGDDFLSFIMSGQT